MVETRRLLAVFLIGLLVGVAVTTAAGLGFQRSLGVSVPSVSVTSDCGDSTKDTGWAAQVPNQGYEMVLLNRSIGGPIANSTLTGESDYRLTLMTERARPGCQYEASVRLPNEFDSLTVVHDGQEVLSVQNREGENTRFWRLNDSEL